MSSKTRAKIRERMSQAKLDSLIVNNFVDKPRMEPKPVLHSEVEYDTLHPEETVKEFCSSVKNMLAEYESAKDKLSKLESEMQDLLHFVEMGKDKNAREGFELYRRLCEVRRQRRICKNELDLLYPVYNAFTNTGLLDTLSRLQGECKAKKQMIEGKAYVVRTDILDTFIK